MNNTNTAIRYRVQELYAERRVLETKLDVIDEDLLKLQEQCQHPNRKYHRSCPDCYKEMPESEES